MRLAIILAEFGRTLPDTGTIAKYFPKANLQVFSDADVSKVFEDHPRFGWRMNDYWKVRKMMDSGADIAIAFDSDMRIVSPDVQVLPLLAERFGLCLPANPRHLVRVDTKIGADSDGQLDETLGSGYAYNCTPIGLNLHNAQAMDCADRYCKIMLEHPVRGPLAWWRAAWKTGFAPYLLPPQWCVCEANIGIGNEIILHEGHERVKQHYKGLQG